MSIEPRSWNRPSIDGGIGRAVLVAALHVGQAEGKLESLRRPVGALFGELLEPLAKVLRHGGDLVLPHAIDRGTEAVVLAIVNLANRGRQPLLRGRQVLRRQRQQAVGLQPPQRRRLHLMEQVAARQRIHLLQRRRRLERRQPIHRRHQELVRARGIPLQRGQRVRAARPAAARRARRGSCRSIRTMPSAGSHWRRCHRSQRDESDRFSSGLSSYR